MFAGKLSSIHWPIPVIRTRFLHEELSWVDPGNEYLAARLLCGLAGVPGPGSGIGAAVRLSGAGRTGAGVNVVAGVTGEMAGLDGASVVGPDPSSTYAGAALAHAAVAQYSNPLQGPLPDCPVTTRQPFDKQKMNKKRTPNYSFPEVEQESPPEG